MYEVETRVQGRSRDLLIASSGAVLETEEEAAWDSLPEAVRTALRQAAGNGQISKVEAVSRDGRKTYEAEIRKQGRREEITVTEDGRLVR